MISLRHISRTARLLGVCLLLVAPAAGATEVGKPTPYFEVTATDGTVFKSSDAKGEVIVLHLWATWCTFCRVEMPILETYYRKHKDKGLRMIAVSMDDPGDATKVQDVMKHFSYTSGVGHLSELKGFGRIWRLPMTFVIDRDGVLRKDGSEGDPKIDLPLLESVVTPLLDASANTGTEQRQP